MPLFYRSAAGAEIDVLLEIPGEGRWAIDITRGLTARPDRGFYLACDDVQPARRFVVNAGTAREVVSTGVETLGVNALASMLSSLHRPGNPPAAQ